MQIPKFFHEQELVEKTTMIFKAKENWRAKEAESKSISKSKSGDLRLNFTSRTHYHHEILTLKVQNYAIFTNSE